MTLLQLPVGHGARRKALELTERVAECCLRLRDEQDVEALHDFRVSLRRLRSFLRAWTGQVPVGRKTRRRLRRLSRRTSALRDSEVALRWLQEQREALTPGQRRGWNWLVARIDVDQEREYEKLRRELPPAWARLEIRLRKRLNAPFAETLGAESFSTASGARIDEACSRLEQRLDRVVDIDSDEAAHAARISAKRLRYLIESLRPHLPKVKPVLRELKRLQDLFGELNDAHLLLRRLRQASREAVAERSERLFDLELTEAPEADLRRARRGSGELGGLLALARLVQRRRAERFAEIEQRYLQGRSAPLLEAARAIAAALLGQPPGPGESPSGAPGDARRND